jgi:hypothetical protein
VSSFPLVDVSVFNLSKFREPFLDVDAEFVDLLALELGIEDSEVWL